MTQSLPSKVRCFVTDRTSGAPRAGVTVALAGETDAKTSLLIGLLTSDRAGYVSFDLSGARNLPNLAALLLAPLADPASRIDVLRSLKELAGAEDASHCSAFTLSVTTKAAPADDSCGDTVLPAVQAADPCDYRLSPGSFVSTKPSFLGDGCCENIVPSALPVQQYTLRRVITRGPAANASGEGAIAPVDVTKLPVPVATSITFGEVLEYRQQWFQTV